jgi:coenzyme F420-reducing hydrogenase gamma subunit
MATKQVKMKMKELNQRIRSHEKELQVIYKEAMSDMLDEDKVEQIRQLIQKDVRLIGCLANMQRTPPEQIKALVEITERNIKKFTERSASAENKDLQEGARKALVIEQGKLDLMLWGLRLQYIPQRKSRRAKWEKQIGWKYPDMLQ